MEFWGDVRQRQGPAGQIPNLVASRPLSEGLSGLALITLLPGTNVLGPKLNTADSMMEVPLRP